MDTPESLDSPLAVTPALLAISLAAEKWLAVREQGADDGRLLITFDTIVVLDGEVLGKPIDLEDAWRMLRALSGRTHQVVTGFAVSCPDDPEPRTAAVVTDVQMKRLADDDILEWMASGEFMGCAGAYNIEGQVAEVTADECYLNVTGLPLCHVYAALRSLPEGCVPGTPLWPVAPCDAGLGRTCHLGPRVAGRKPSA